MVSEPGSFAEHTIARRKPQIIANVIASNDYTPEIEADLRAFENEIASGEVQPLHEEMPDTAIWLGAIEPWLGHTWRELPWYLAEAYFYRRIIEVVRYLQPGPWHLHDPFEPQKVEATRQGLDALEQFMAMRSQQASQEEQIEAWMRRSLWGNRVDLSNITVASDRNHDVTGDETNSMLVDHTAAVVRMLCEGQVQRLDLIGDNSGLEHLSDLGWIDHLITHDAVEMVHLHLKPRPFFVSDAMVSDFVTTRQMLVDHEDTALSALGQRIEAHLEDGRLILQDHAFWVSPFFYTTLPADLEGELASSDLLVFKGDANYRRLVEDRHWPPTTPLEEVVDYLPAPMVALRTLKSELVLGLPEGMAARLDREDPDWMINGQHGVIQFVEATL
jgi:uncharacterized protein with ATP-grasp and redox domains